MPLALTVVPEHWLRGREFLLLKKSFDVFTNPNADVLLGRLDPEEIVLFGVATDVCNDAAIRGLLARGRASRSSRRPLAASTRAARPAVPPPGVTAASASPLWTRCWRSFRFRSSLPMGD